MKTPLPALLFALAAAPLADAQETPAEGVKDACDWTPKTTVNPERPRDAVSTTRMVERCEVTLAIDTLGVPDIGEVDGCGDDFGIAASAAFIQWRFSPCTIQGREAEGSLTLAASFAASHFQELPEQQLQSIADQHKRFGTVADDCTLKMRIDEEGEVGSLQSNDPKHCLVVPARAPLNRHLGLERATTCTVELEAADRIAVHKSVKAKNCDKAVAKYAETVLASFAWNSKIADTEHYTVEVTLGPE